MEGHRSLHSQAQSRRENWLSHAQKAEDGAEIRVRVGQFGYAGRLRAQRLESTDVYTHLTRFESDEWHVTHAQNLKEETKLIETRYEFIRFSDKDKVAIYRKRK